MRVMTAGCFDLLHSGHVQFLHDASRFGKLWVAVASSRCVFELKGKPPVQSEQERLFMVQAVRFVHRVFIAQGTGYFNYESELAVLNPDILVVNHDEKASEPKRIFCVRSGIRFVQLPRRENQPFPDWHSSRLRLCPHCGHDRFEPTSC